MSAGSGEFLARDFMPWYIADTLLRHRGHRRSLRKMKPTRLMPTMPIVRLTVRSMILPWSEDSELGIRDGLVDGVVSGVLLVVVDVCIQLAMLLDIGNACTELAMLLYIGNACTELAMLLYIGDACTELAMLLYIGNACAELAMLLYIGDACTELAMLLDVCGRPMVVITEGVSMLKSQLLALLTLIRTRSAFFALATKTRHLRANSCTRSPVEQFTLPIVESRQ